MSLVQRSINSTGGVAFGIVKRKEGGERERALDDVFGIWVTVRSCCEKRIETKLCKSC